MVEIITILTVSLRKNEEEKNDGESNTLKAPCS